MSFSEKEIWILEDDKGCQFVYEQTLDHRYKTRYFSKIADFQAALEATTEDPALLIADLMLDDGNFMTYLNSGKDPRLMVIPFIIVSSIDDIDALRYCFMEGAIDYLTKPFKKNELIVKIENIFSGAKKSSVSTHVGGQKSVLLDGREIGNLTSKQKQLLGLFLDNPDRVVTRDDILDNVWGDTNVHPKTVDVHLYNLRRKLHDMGYIIRSEGGGKWSLISDTI
ncbi:response regulator transcription factor [Bacteriovorax sp. Seq25_V]|uniref:response regulator transcription factor n=1 Tax=Bacteriovorax sp. Seq25_V TaxID=1201288 RepID=UPI00038A04D0|nr:response regulator transcription factor [Bacteriovorax sp. Seq25_V]EQC45319.1 transcriptional regulatory protein, C-terminal domain protein [Bacteriovorax sp. Seq25_V]